MAKGEIVFRGAFPATMDAKMRMSIHVGFRQFLRENDLEKLVLTFHLDGCLLAFPASEYGKIIAKLDERPAFDERANRLRRRLIAQSYELSLDKQGRILIPQFLREHAALKTEIVQAGVGRRFEIWALERWRERELADLKPANEKELREDIRELGL
jgi:MraZ protein